MDILTLFFNVILVLVCLISITGLYLGTVKKNYRAMFLLVIFGLICLALLFFMVRGILS